MYTLIERTLHKDNIETIGETGMNNNRAVLYLRLSKEDVDKLNKGDDSASIQNQRLLLMDYALEKDFQVVGVYSDDDESGLYDDRPDFERMMRSAKLGEFDVIIAKTQARLSRNMEHIEKYLHHDLPNMGIRFIGVVDGVDTANAGNKKSRQINGLVNEWYCEDLSANIRSAFKVKMKAGQFLGSSCCYGYIKDPQNHNHLIIDEYAADVVKRIFDLYIQGHGKAKIGAILSSEGILIPTHYKREVLGINFKNGKEIETTQNWSYQTIHQILNNETYIGNLIQNKANKLSYKDRKCKKTPKDKWIKVENTHEPIIDKETFELVQRLQQTRTKSVDAIEANGIFSGLLFCADCKHAMSRKYARRGDRGFIGYMCKTYKVHGKQVCESHSIDKEELEEAVLMSIKDEARKILRDEDIDELKSMQSAYARRTATEAQKTVIQNRIKKVEGFKKSTYNNLMEGILTKNEYIQYVADYENELAELQKQIEYLDEQTATHEQLEAQYDEWVEAFKNYINISALTRDVVIELINRIEINKDGSINIYYKFENPYENC